MSNVEGWSELDNEGESEREARAERERIRVFEELEKGPGWVKFQELLAQRIADEGASLLEPSGSLDGLVGMEFRKGYMRGLVFARDMVRVTLAAYRERKS